MIFGAFGGLALEFFLQKVPQAPPKKQFHAAAGGPVDFVRQIVHLSHEYQHS